MVSRGLSAGAPATLVASLRVGAPDAGHAAAVQARDIGRWLALGRESATESLVHQGLESRRVLGRSVAGGRSVVFCATPLKKNGLAGSGPR